MAFEGQKMTTEKKDAEERDGSTASAGELSASAFRKLASQFNLHVLLIQEQDGATQNRARVLAWHEGTPGLAKRLGAAS